MARTPFIPNAEQRLQVTIMAACGFQHSLICERIINHQSGRPIDGKTLRKAFREELDDGISQANAMVAQSLFKKAIGNSPQSVSAAIWWEKTRAGKRDITLVEQTGKDGGPMQHEITQGVHAMTDDELERIARTGGA